MSLGSLLCLGLLLAAPLLPASAWAAIVDRGGDCNDVVGFINSDAPEIPGNARDDDCDGIADDVNGVPPADTLDRDSDGVDVQQGDCNDGDSGVKPGTAEIVGNLYDDDCDGLADESAANVPSADAEDRDGDGQAMFDGVFRNGFE